MKKIAMVKNNVVVNVSIWDTTTEWNPGKDFRLFDVTEHEVGIGDILEGDIFKKIKKDAEYSEEGELISEEEYVNISGVEEISLVVL